MEYYKSGKTNDKGIGRNNNPSQGQNDVYSALVGNSGKNKLAASVLAQNVALVEDSSSKKQKNPKNKSAEEIYRATMAEIYKAECGKEGENPFDIADKFLCEMADKPKFYEGCSREHVWSVIFDMLERKYNDVIIDKYQKLYDEITRFGSEMEYKASQYPGSFEQYARAQAIKEIEDMYKQTRYGGYMHVIIMNILNRHFAEERAKDEAQRRQEATKKVCSIYIKKSIPNGRGSASIMDGSNPYESR